MKIEWNNITPEQYNALRLSVGWDPVTKAQAEIGLKNSSVLTAVEDGKVLGMVRSLSDGAIQSLIAEVAVAPEYQHRGIASLLMREALRHEKCGGGGIF